MNWLEQLSPDQTTPPKELVRTAPRKKGADFSQFLDQALKQAGPQQVAAVLPGQQVGGISPQLERAEGRGGGRGAVAKQPGSSYNYVGL